MRFWKMALAGACAGSVTGLFGAGGGMVLVPLLILLTDLDDQQIFSASLSIILPLSIVSIIAHGLRASLPWAQALPYLIGGAAGGLLAGLLGKRIPTVWLHRMLGALILWGGFRYL